MTKGLILVSHKTSKSLGDTVVTEIMIYNIGPVYNLADFSNLFSWLCLFIFTLNSRRKSVGKIDSLHWGRKELTSSKIENKIFLIDFVKIAQNLMLINIQLRFQMRLGSFLGLVATSRHHTFKRYWIRILSRPYNGLMLIKLQCELLKVWWSDVKWGW